MAYGLAMSILSVILAWITLNPVATSMIALGIFFYVMVYTVWLKRYNAANIVIGGFAGSAASMAGWAAATGSINLARFSSWMVGVYVDSVSFLVSSDKSTRGICERSDPDAACSNWK